MWNQRQILSPSSSQKVALASQGMLKAFKMRAGS